MSRQRTGSYFQRQSNISNVDQTPQRRVVLLPTNLWNRGPGRLVWVRFASSPGRLLQRVNYTARASDRSWQIPLSLETRRVCGNCPRQKRPICQPVILRRKGTRCGRRLSSITRKNPRSVGPNQVTTKRVLCRNEKTQPTYTTRLTENIHKTTCRGLCVFPGDC